MRIRSARNEDLKACLQLDASFETESAWQMVEERGERAWGMQFREVHLPRKQRILHPLQPEERLQAWLRRDGFWVAVERRKVQGYLALALEPDHRQARITDLVIAPEFRRQGFADQLLAHATEWCLRQTVEQLVMECPPKAQPAIAFALGHGFSFCGFQDGYWPEQQVGLFLRKRIKRADSTAP